MDKQTFIKSLKPYRDVLSKQTMKTLRGQALSGDMEGARKGLLTVLRRRGDSCERSK